MPGSILSRLEVVGQAVPVLQGAATNPGGGSAQLAFSLDGLLTYVPGTVVTRAMPMNWTTREEHGIGASRDEDDLGKSHVLAGSWLTGTAR